VPNGGRGKLKKEGVRGGPVVSYRREVQRCQKKEPWKRGARRGEKSLLAKETVSTQKKRRYVRRGGARK